MGLEATTTPIEDHNGGQPENVPEVTGQPGDNGVPEPTDITPI